MKLETKKKLASTTLGVGKNKIIFNIHRLEEIKEAITKQDIRDLYMSGAIIIREINGRRKVVRRKIRRKAGSIKKPVKNKKREYVILTRKFRNYLFELKRKSKLSNENYIMLRKEIKARAFKSKAQLKERISTL
jgi:large subunit ribosomal protein L19e